MRDVGLPLTALARRESPDPVRTFVAPYLERARRVIRAAGPVARSIVDGLARDLAATAELAVAQAFYEFREIRGLPADSATNGALTMFVDHLERGGSDTLMRRYPVLDRLLLSLTEYRVRQAHEILEAFAADGPTLCHTGLVPPGPVTAIDIAAGDAHDHGRRVAIVTVGDQTAPSVVYKPRGTDAEDLLISVLALVDPEGDLRIPAHRPGGLERSGSRAYGWHEFVAPTELRDHPAAPAAFHRRLGSWLAVFTALGSTDMHFDNLYAVGDHPVPIDIEALLHPPTENPNLSDAHTCALSNGPMGTTMLPVGGAADIAAISRFGRRTTNGTTHCSTAGSGTDAFTIVARGSSFLAVCHRPVEAASGRPVRVSDHVHDIVDGFLATSGRVRCAQVELRDLVGQFADGVFRRMIRPTSVYSALLTASIHPCYLEDEKTRARLFGMLPAAATSTAGMHDIEFEALMRHDVPRFADCADADGIGGSAVDRARRCIDSLAATPPVASVYLIRSALTGIDDFSTHLTPVAVAGDDLHRALADPSAVSGAARLSRRLAARSSSSGSTVHAIPGADGKPVLVASDVSLYNGGGVALLTAAVAQSRPMPVWNRRTAASVDDLVADATSWCDAMRAGETRGSSCPYTGAVGTIWLLRELSSVDPRARRAADELMSFYTRTFDPDLERTDVVGGLAGAGALLAAFGPAAFGDQYRRVEDVLVRTGDRLSQMLRPTLCRAAQDRSGELGPDVRGVAHGLDGAAWALARIDACLGRSGSADLLCDVLGLGTRPNSSRSWCWGQAGIVAVHAEIAWTLGDADRALRIVDDFPAADTSDDCMCHGESGAVLLLSDLAGLLGNTTRPGDWSATGDPALRDLCERRSEALLARLSRRGYASGHRDPVGVATFMTGVAGIAYTRLASRPCADLANPVSLRPSTSARTDNR